jgi:hypothetical protein
VPTGRDTPGVVLLITEPAPVLIAIEAKMYDRPGDRGNHPLLLLVPKQPVDY